MLKIGNSVRYKEPTRNETDPDHLHPDAAHGNMLPEPWANSFSQYLPRGAGYRKYRDASGEVRYRAGRDDAATYAGPEVYDHLPEAHNPTGAKA